MINSFLKNISNFIKRNFTKIEYNSKLIDLKTVILTDKIEFSKNKLHPLTKGLLLDERKDQYEEINLDSDSTNCCCLKTQKDIQILKIITNYSINYTSWLDYLKRIIFGNKNQENLSYLKFFKKYKNSREIKDHNFMFNCNGKFMGFINKKGDVIISSTESNSFGYAIESNLDYKRINSFSWDTIYPNKLFYSINNILYECIINEKDLTLYKNKYYSLSNFPKFINCFPSPKGDLIILLYEKYIEVYDLFQNLLFSKFFTTFKFVNALYDKKSSVFITYTEDRIIIFNLDTFDFKSYSYFPGTIIKVIINPKSDNIYIFVIDKSKPFNELLMFTLDDMSISSDINLNFNSYNNNENFYRHNHYVLRPDIFAFQYEFKSICNVKQVLDVCISPNDLRIGILYEEEFPGQFKQNSLYIFRIIKDNRDNTIKKIIPLYNFGHIDGSQILSFDFNKLSNKENTSFVVRFENDNFIKAIQING